MLFRSALGIPTVLYGARYVANQLYLVKPYDPLSLVAAVTVLSASAAIAGFIPALAAALGLYSLIRQETLLPVMMSEMRLLAVFAAALGMAVISALLSVWVLRRADPADVF